MSMLGVRFSVTSTTLRGKDHDLRVSFNGRSGHTSSAVYAITRAEALALRRELDRALNAMPPTNVKPEKRFCIWTLGGGENWVALPEYLAYLDNCAEGWDAIDRAQAQRVRAMRDRIAAEHGREG